LITPETPWKLIQKNDHPIRAAREATSHCLGIQRQVPIGSPCKAMAKELMLLAIASSVLRRPFAMPAAARIGDLHSCPMQTPAVPAPILHVGGPIIGPGAPTVLIGGTPAACVGDYCMCVGPPDAIVKGSSSVLIGGMPAARMGDTCAHGGSIAVGFPTVQIGG
jgi:uncharacterized Zn-binding protein involved in type VI secretion